MEDNEELELEDFKRLAAFLASDVLPDGCMDMVSLDGFLTGISVRPMQLPSSKWLPYVFGGPSEYNHNATFKKEEEAEEIIRLILLHQREIISGLQQMPPECYPIVPPTVSDEDDQTLLANWCDGFLFGFSLDNDNNGSIEKDDETASILLPILLNSSLFDEDNSSEMRTLQAELTEKYQNDWYDLIENAVLELNAYYLVTDKKQSDFLDPISNTQPQTTKIQIKRNDPCPCGSGKKYKKCCM